MSTPPRYFKAYFSGFFLNKYYNFRNHVLNFLGETPKMKKKQIKNKALKCGCECESGCVVLLFFFLQKVFKLHQGISSLNFLIIFV